MSPHQRWSPAQIESERRACARCGAHNWRRFYCTVCLCPQLLPLSAWTQAGSAERGCDEGGDGHQLASVIPMEGRRQGGPTLGSGEGGHGRR